MPHYYTDEVNTLILISLLKEHNIRKIIASPGTTNISFVGSVQVDPYFEVYSAVDERAAAFMACGLAEESGEAVVLTCTGATASRNYIPGLTEAFYRNLPVLAVTYTQHNGKIGHYVAQVVDRTKQFPDMVKKSIQLPTIYSKEEVQYAVTAVNEGLLELMHGRPGPVHLNLCTTYSNRFVTTELPKYRVIRRVIDTGFPEMPKGKIGIFVGAHAPFTKEETNAIDSFCENHNAVVICDQISNYRGKYRFLANKVNSQAVDLGIRNFDLLIYIGYVHGAYINFRGEQLWRVNPDGVVRDPYRNLTYVFEMDEIAFFTHYVAGSESNTLWEQCQQATALVSHNVPELPFSNMWIAKETACAIPENSVLHFSILNSLRAWNFFETPDSVCCYSNTGGFGIDGCVSSFVGAALTNSTTEHYMIVGDLSFFYDINTLFNQLPNNIHIMLVNNGVGTEFKNYNHRAAYFGDEADQFIAAKGHNGGQRSDVVKCLCEQLNIKYLFASCKEEYLEKRQEWLATSITPVLFEVITSDWDESIALQKMNTIVKDKSIKGRLKASFIGRIAKRIFRGTRS